MEKVSVIVPVYKVEKYLGRCIRSLIGQTYENLEVILVDDGSPDRCGVICDEFAQMDSRIIVIHQVNRGVSAARNNGLEKVSGDWICFCDGDDWYAPNYVEKMLACALQQNADHVICNYQIVAENGSKLVSGSVAALRNSCDRKNVIALGPTSSCTHLISRKLFVDSGVRYPLGRKQYEELPVIPVLAKYAQHIALVDEPLYNYFQRGNGTSASNVATNSEESFRACWRIMCEELGDEYRQEAEYHAIYALLYGEVLRMCKQKYVSREICMKIDSFKKEFPGYRSNPYFKQMGLSKKMFLTLAHFKCIAGARMLAWVHGKIVN